jgi:hypothetical protein
MSLPNSYTQKVGAIPDYFESILNAEAPERFTNQFLAQLEFKSTNDRMLIGILKDLGFLDPDGSPTQRYFEFLDRTQSKSVLAEGIQEAYADLFRVNKKAYELNDDEVKNKLRTLYEGSKKDDVITKIAKTFVALCDYADFTAKPKKEKQKTPVTSEGEPTKTIPPDDDQKSNIELSSLQYHINIVLPESRDQAVYDAIFKSLRDHLG